MESVMKTRIMFRQILFIFLGMTTISITQGADFCSLFGANFPSICSPATTTTTPRSTPDSPCSKCDANKIVVGYISELKDDYKNFIISMTYLTHAIFAFVPVSEDGALTLANSPPSDISRLKYLKQVKTQTPLKTMFSVGAYGNSNFYSNITASPTKTDTFVAAVLQFLDEWDMDGVDIDWESPVAGGLTAGVPEDRANFVRFLKVLRAALDSKSAQNGKTYILTIASSGGIYSLEKGFDLMGLSQYVDWFNIMAYDFYGAWQNSNGLITGPHAPLYFGAPDTYTRRANVDFTLKSYYCQTKLLSKMVLGLGFYGRYWNHSGTPVNVDDPLWRKASTTDGDILDYRRVKRDFLSKPQIYSRTFHNKVKMPYVLSQGNDPFLMAYEDEESIAIKVKYAMQKGLRGVMVWAVEYDDESRALLNTVKAGMKDCCGVEKNPYKCSPLPRGDVRWSTNSTECGKDAPLVGGYYAICDPENADAGCCSNTRRGRCGVGKAYCDCDECIDYYNDPNLALREPVKPVGNQYTSESM